MTPPSELSKTDRIPELRNELPKKYPETKRDAEEWEKHRQKMTSNRKEDQNDDQADKNTLKNQQKEKSEDHELGKDPNLGEEVDFRA